MLLYAVEKEASVIRTRIFISLKRKALEEEHLAALLDPAARESISGCATVFLTKSVFWWPKAAFLQKQCRFQGS